MSAPKTCSSCKWYGATHVDCCDFVDTIWSNIQPTRFEIEVRVSDGMFPSSEENCVRIRHFPSQNSFYYLSRSGVN